jgi:hypothetical protein
MDDAGILASVRDLVEEEHRLRAQVASGGLDLDEEHRRLAELEVQLDQCWDLLRQRRAKREFDQDVDAAEVRAAGQVEGYRQ